MLLLAALAAPSAHAESHERPNGGVNATCTSVTFYYRGFPNLPNNTVNERVYIHGPLVYEDNFQFNGPTGEHTIPIKVPPGPGKVDGKAKWNTNGFSGNWDIAWQLNCSFPAFTIEKLQMIQGSGEPFGPSPLIGKVGQTVDYQIIVKNTGNVPLTFTNFTDPKCSGISGGPSGPIEPTQSTTYTCEHVLTAADEKQTLYANQAQVTGTPPKNEGPTVKHTSNEVVVNFLNNHEREHGGVIATCNSITFFYRGFPNLPNNTVNEKVFVHGKLVFEDEFHFNGPKGEHTIPITVPAGKGKVDGKVKWNTNGAKGNWDIAWGLVCPPNPAFSIEKLQKIEGHEEPFTTADVAAKAGDTVDYKIIVGNTGNEPLTFTNFTDTQCEGIAGGPSGAVEPGQTATYTCHHLLAPAPSEYQNNATVTGNPPKGEGEPVTHTSNTVVAKLT
jgi:uncharacterized repeat protein (TIGR01451 family)